MLSQFLRPFATVAAALLVMITAVLATAVPPAAAQTADRSGIEGKLSDETGGVLPGVTVTLSSPALQTRHLTTVSDGEGRYRFTNLPPGAYTVSYELSGFQTVKRDGVRLTAGFVATLDAKLGVATLEETVTVTTASPVVDVRTTSVSTNFTKEALESVPTSRSMWEIMSLSPGVRVTSTTPDVGGNTVGTQQGYQNYGSGRGGNRPTIEGVNTRENITAAGFYYDFGAFEEVQIKAMGNDAEVAESGTNFVGIVKSGGDAFHGTYLFQWETPKLQSNNLDDNLRDQGVRAGNPLKQYYDVNADLGGRIVRDRVWFYGAARAQRIRTGLIGYSRTAGADGRYGTPDDEPGEYLADLYVYTGKITSQVTRKHKLVAFYQYNKKDYPEREGSAFMPAEATAHNLFVPEAGKLEWTYVATDRSFVNLFVGRSYFVASYEPYTDAPSTYDTVTLMWGGASVNVLGPDPEPSSSKRDRLQYNGSYTYFTQNFLGGQHDFKIGAEFTQEYYSKIVEARQNRYDYLLRLQNGAPFEVVLYNSPFVSENKMNMQAGYVKDSWRIGDRLTLNLGVRFERYHAFLPPQAKEAGTFSEAATFPKREVQEWRAMAPRAALSYALTSDSRTVVKATYGRFNYVLAADKGRAFNESDLVQTTYRWNDLNGNGRYEADERGSFVRSTGGTSGVPNLDLEQPKVDEVTFTLEREIIANFSGRASYILKREFNLYQSVNVLRSFDVYNVPITTVDPGPDGRIGTADDGGPVTYYDYDAAFRGPAFERFVETNTPGYTDKYHNLEIVLNRRLSNRWQMLASYLATKRDVWRNGIPQEPNTANFFPKDQTWEWMFKLSGSCLLPYDFQVAAFFSHRSGVAYARDVRFTTGLRQLSSLILLMEPVGSQRRPNQNLLNFRIEKRQRVKVGEVAFQFDVFNAMNTNAAANISGRSGPTYDRITAIVPPRVARFGITYSF